MKVLVTGALGFVGVNLCLYYLSLGADVIAVDNKFKHLGVEKNLERIVGKGARFIHADIRNPNDVETIFMNEPDIDLTMHMAAQVAFKRSIENPRFDFEVNALGTFNLLESLRIHQPGSSFILASTNQVYGELKDVPVIEKDKRFDFSDLPHGIPETFPLDFLSPYGCSKGAADQYTLDYARVYDLRTAVLRFGGIYGDFQYSYEDHGWISYISKMVLKDLPFNRFGHGKQVRDILYISDIVRAVNLCAENIDEVRGQAINIGGGPGNTLSVLELLDLLQDLTGNREKSAQMPMRKADKLVCYLDIRKAAALLGWEPQVGKVIGIERLLQWLKTEDF